MTNIKLRESSKIIVDVFPFQKDSSTFFRVEYVDCARTGKTYTDKNGNTKDQLEKVIKYLFIDKKNLGAEYDKKSSAEICQDLKGKSVIITTIIGD